MLRSRASLFTALLSLLVPALIDAQQPVFRAGVDLLRLDVRVVGDDGTPVTDLEESAFDVRVNGKACPVRTLQFLDFTAAERASTESRYRDVSSNIAPTLGRLTVLAIDEDSLPEDSRPLMNSLAGYVNTLGPNDRTALLALPRPGIWHDFTNDAAELKNLLLRTSARGSLADENALAGMQANRGLGRGEVQDPRAPRPMLPQAIDPGLQNLDLIHALEDLARALKEVEGPKTLVLVSSRVPAGIELDDYHNFAREAAEARLTIYILKPHAFVASATGNQSQIGEPLAGIEGLDVLAGMTGGVVLNAVARATGVIERIGRETSGNYVLGVEPPAGAPRNKPLDVTVRVRRPGLTVRSPRQVVAPAPGARKKKAEDSKTLVGSLLRQPRVATEVPLRVTAYGALGADSAKVKTVIVAELDEAPSDAGKVAWGFEVHDGDRIVADGFEETKANGSHMLRDVLVGSAPLAPGRYSLRLAAIDAGGRRASVEHSLDVGLHAAGDVEYSDLFVGEAVEGHFRPRITVDAAPQLVAFVELYATELARLGQVSVEFTLRGLDGASRVATRVPARPTSAGATKSMAQAGLPLAHVAPGLYDVVATVLEAGRPIGAVRREVVIGQER
jgi:VWFA-related protein